MPYDIDETHDPNLESWVESANDPETDFPIQNLPLCMVQNATAPGYPFCAARVGDVYINLEILAPVYFQDCPPLAMAESPPAFYSACFASSVRVYLRHRLRHLLRADCPDLRDNAQLRAMAVLNADQCALTPPFMCRDYTDFYASVHHATNVGSMFRPDNPLLPNYKWIPVGYHGRASSVVPSGTDIVRPRGQTAPTEDGGAPGFGPCKLLDYELEMGVVMGRGNELGTTVAIDDAEDHILGLCLLNDWSARDLQKWEYQPLGPFLAKSFATTVSPYIVTMEALAPFRAPRAERAQGDPRPLAHLDSDHDRAHGALDITLEVSILTEQMRTKGMAPHRISRGNFKDMYWTIAQMVTHHASNGCNLNAGDLLGSGTVSGPTRDSRGCLLELTWDGDPWATPPVVVPGTQRTPITLPTGEERKFLADGDEVVLTGFCEREGFRRIGFGECRGVVRPAAG